MNKKTENEIKKLIVNGKDDNPKLLYQELSDGRISLYLHFILANEAVVDSDGNLERGADGRIKRKQHRKNQALNLYYIPNPKTPIEKEANKEAIIIANKAKKEAMDKMEKAKGGIKAHLAYSKDILSYFHDFVEKTHVRDKRLLKSALKNFETFLIEEYPIYTYRDSLTGEKRLSPISVDCLNKTMMEQFASYLRANHRGEGVRSYWQRFKRLINSAIDEKIMFENPCRKVKMQFDRTISKAILEEAELKALFATHYKGENPEIRRGFAFTCYSGVRRCDVVRLTYSMVDYERKTLTFTQSKVDGHSGSAKVEVALNDTLLSIIGTKEADAEDDLIFHLPSDVMCLKALKHWAARAGIDKNITWHSGRHSFATLLLDKGANIKVVSELLGHSSLKFTQIYVHTLADQKKRALDSLPSLDLDNI